MINKTTGSKTDKKRIVSFDLDMTLFRSGYMEDTGQCHRSGGDAAKKTVLLSSPAAEIWMEWSVWATNNRYGQMQ